MAAVASRMISGTCHCGAVSIDVPAPPASLLSCNCSLCRRTGGLWAFYAPQDVRVSGHPEHTEAYVWGDRTLRTVRCRHCGSVTHWESLQPQVDQRCGVNFRNFAPELVASLPVRRFDGADTWAFLDDDPA